MQRYCKEMQLFSHKKSSWVLCPQRFFFCNWNRATTSQVPEKEHFSHTGENTLISSKSGFPPVWKQDLLWWGSFSPKYVQFPTWNPLPLEERKKKNPYPSKRDYGLCLEIMSFKLLFFGKKLGKCRNIHLSEVSTSAALWARNSSWPKCGHVLGLCKAVLWF